jgi:hypothetical protein
MKLSKGNHSICRLTDEGKRVVEQIIKPLVLALNGDEIQVHSFRETDPKVEHLVTPMEIYSRNLETSCRDL